MRKGVYLVVFLGFVLAVGVSHAWPDLRALPASTTLPQVATATDPAYAKLREGAEILYGQGSYAKAHQAYERMAKLTLAPDDGRWVRFRLADTSWRSDAATNHSDSSVRDAARRELEDLHKAATRDELKDRIWAEVTESLGDFWWENRHQKNWGSSWPYYQQALEWWAGARDIELARSRYLAIVFKTALPTWREPYYYYGYYGNYLPIEVVENAAEIAQTEADKAHAHYLLAMTFRNRGGDWRQRARIPEEFDQALELGRQTDWYDDALYQYAEWMAYNGRSFVDASGAWRQEPDYKKAVELYRRLIREHKKGETRFYDTAKNRLDQITNPQVSVGVSNIFLPDSEIQYHLNWRNVSKIDLALYRVDLTDDIAFKNRNIGASQWLDQVTLRSSARLKSWTKNATVEKEYQPGASSEHYEDELKPGAYVLEAKAGGQKARELILVSDMGVVLKSVNRKALVYTADVMTGAPSAGTEVIVHERYYDDNKYHWASHRATTDDKGLVLVELTEKGTSSELFVVAKKKDRQSFSNGYTYNYSTASAAWKLYAFTDRPAYRPGDTVSWKLVARTYDAGKYSTPSGQSLEYEIRDPRGTKLKEDTIKLNAFGSGWATFDLDDEMALGAFRVDFYETRNNARYHVGSANLFRLEEYKLPEFKVSVSTPEDEDGNKKTFRIGDEVEAEIDAQYYFGAPVAEADVEIVVYQRPYYRMWFPQRDYPWYYDDLQNQYSYYWGRGSQIKRERLKTDGEGKASLTLTTPVGTQQDLELEIEARVTDPSRREVVGTGVVRVTRFPYYVNLRPQHNIYRPGDRTVIEIQAADATDQPIQTTGRVTVTRDYWFEVWTRPDGTEVKGEELRLLRQAGPFPPAPEPDGEPWKLKSRGYEHDEIMTTSVKTDADGKAEIKFQPQRDGYYRVRWVSEQGKKDRWGQPLEPVTSETTVWVATNATTELGYRHGGVELILDKDTFRAGDKAPVMISTPTNDRWVLFTVEGEDLYHYELVHVTGTVKLVNLDIDEKYVPNVYLSAVMLHDAQMFSVQKQVVVPPTKHFLSVDVSADKEELEPRETGTFKIEVKDHDDKPVQGEVAFSVIDESVLYIQKDLAGDPRQFFFGQKRSQYVQMQATFNYRSYLTLVETTDGKLEDGRLRELRRQRNEEGNLLPESEPDDANYRYADATTRAATGKSAVAGLVTEDEEQTASLDYGARVHAEVPASRQAAEKLPAGRDNKEAGSEGGEGGQGNVTVRSDFRATAFWQPDVLTDTAGRARVKVKFPDTLTSWKAIARVSTEGNQFGIGDTLVRTRQPLVVRLQAPRFFLSKDEVTVSAVINNNTGEALTVTPRIEAKGISLRGYKDGDRVRRGSPRAKSVPAGGSWRVDWVAAIDAAGEARIQVSARAGKHNDAMERSYPIYEHGIEKFVARSGKIDADDATITLELPGARKADSTRMSIQVTPSIAVTMLDALPYLIDYPYGCTEQTMSRFMPLVMVTKTLQDLGLKRQDIADRVYGGIETEHADKTHPEGKKDLAEMEAMTKKSLARLYDFQHGDGGWGWWKEGESDHFMTAYVVWGLILAEEAGINVRDGVISRGVSFLQTELVEEEEHADMQAWMLHALAYNHTRGRYRHKHAYEQKAFDNLWGRKDELNAYTRALYTLAAVRYGEDEKAKILADNLANGVVLDKSPDTSIIQRGAQTAGQHTMATAHWGNDGVWWRWSDGGVEATAFALKALVAVNPKHELVEPTMNWLVKNRRGAQWSNTRDTAIVVLALNDYLQNSGELGANVEYEVSVNGKRVAKKKVTAADVLGAPSVFDIDAKLIKSGKNELRLRRTKGTSPLYFATHATFFSQEEPVTPAGNEIFVRRQYYKLVGRPTLLKGYVYDRVPLADGDHVRSGERIEAIVTIEAKNNYEYLLFEDLKPAGVEAVAVQSGQTMYAKELKSAGLKRKTSDRIMDATDYTGRSQWVYQELRDRQVAMFINKLPQGTWEMRYDLRAEIPGTFHALPVMGHAMYVPEIRCNGQEVRMEILDRTAEPTL